MKVCVIVDGFSAGKLLPKLINKKGYPCVHVKSREKSLRTGSKYIPEDYIECLTHTGNIDVLLAALKKYEVVCVIPGSEPGVELADKLSELLKLETTNGSKMSKARRNKFAMAEALSTNKIKTPLYFKSSDVNEVLVWIKSNTTWPVVVKVLDSSGTDGVFICSSQDEVRASFKKIMGVENYMGQVNTEVLVQSYLKGDEYVINSVSCNGKHYVVDMSKYIKKYIKGQGNIYDREYLLPIDGEVQSSLISYTHKVLDALQISYGPTHAEVILTEDGPVLVEVGARLGGATNIEVSDECIGRNAVQLTVDCYLDQKEFHRVVQKPHELKKHSMIVDLINEQEGVVEKTTLAEEIKKLPSVRHSVVKVKAGDVIKKTVDLFSSPATVQLVHESKEQLEADYQKLQNIAKKAIVIEKRSSCAFSKMSSRSLHKFGLFAGTVVMAGALAYKIYSRNSGTTFRAS